MTDLREQIEAALEDHSIFEGPLVDAKTGRTLIDDLAALVEAQWQAGAEWGMEAQRQIKAYVDANPITLPPSLGGPR